MRYYGTAVLATIFTLFEPQLDGLSGSIPNLTPFRDPDEVCFDVVGCFNNRAPWYTGQRRPFPPKPPQEVSSHMFFHNRQTKDRNGTKFQIYPTVDFSNVPFSEKKQTFIISHGWGQSGDTQPYVSLAKELLKRRDANVFLVDYSHSSPERGFYQGIGDIRVAGRLAAIALLKTKISPSKMHLIGHSLGAQVVAYIANYITEKKGKPARLTALDAGLPQFEIFNDDIVRLDKEDAEYIDVVHTASGQVSSPLPIGHIDFYINGGLRQPSCEDEESISDINKCSHMLSLTLYTRSVEEDGCIVGEKKSLLEVLVPAVAAISSRGTSVNASLHCDVKECVSMGMGLHKGQEGVFYVPTSKPPYICNNKF